MNTITNQPEQRTAKGNRTMYTRDPEMALALLFIVGSFVYASAALLLMETLTRL